MIWILNSHQAYWIIGYSTNFFCAIFSVSSLNFSRIGWFTPWLGPCYLRFHRDAPGTITWMLLWQFFLAGEATGPWHCGCAFWKGQSWRKVPRNSDGCDCDILWLWFFRSLFHTSITRKVVKCWFVSIQMTNVFGLGATSWNSWVFQFWILIDSARLESHTTGERRTGMLPSTVVGTCFFLNRFVFFFLR